LVGAPVHELIRVQILRLLRSLVHGLIGAFSPECMIYTAWNQLILSVPEIASD